MEHAGWKSWMRFAVRIALSAVILMAIERAWHYVAPKLHLEAISKTLAGLQCDALHALQRWTPWELPARYFEALTGNRPSAPPFVVPIPGRSEGLPVGFPSDPLAGTGMLNLLFRPFWALYIVLYDLFGSSAMSCVISTIQAAIGAGATILIRFSFAPRPGHKFWLWVVPLGAVLLGSLIGGAIELVTLLALALFQGLSGILTQLGISLFLCKTFGAHCFELVFHHGVESQVKRVV